MELLKCEMCERMELKRKGCWCGYLDHPLENGYAMECHSAHCDGFQERGRERRNMNDEYYDRKYKNGSQWDLRTICFALFMVTLICLWIFSGC